MESKIALTSSDDIAFVTLVNEARANSIDKTFCDELLSVFREIEGASKYRAVILQARGRIFSAGGELRQIFDGVQRSDSYLESLITALHATIVTMRRLPIPLIVSVQGAAAGAGFSLAMACDLVVASSTARFVVGYAKLGTSSDGGLSFHLARRLGAARALEILLTRDSLTADEAMQLGLVQSIAEPASLQDATLALARKVIDVPVAAVREMKSLVGMVAEDNLERHLEQEKHAFLRCASTKEFSERVAQFIANAESPRSTST